MCRLIFIMPDGGVIDISQFVESQLAVEAQALSWELLWIDTGGEAVVPAEELWWAAFASGARSVSGFVMKTAEEWARQPSVGIIEAG